MLYVGYWGPSAISLLFGFIACVSRNRGMMIVHCIIVGIVSLGHLGCTIAVMVLESDTIVDYLALYIPYLACEAFTELPLCIFSIVLLVRWKAAHTQTKVSPLDPILISP